MLSPHGGRNTAGMRWTWGPRGGPAAPNLRPSPAIPGSPSTRIWRVGSSCHSPGCSPKPSPASRRGGGAGAAPPRLQLHDQNSDPRRPERQARRTSWRWWLCSHTSTLTLTLRSPHQAVAAGVKSPAQGWLRVEPESRPRSHGRRSPLRVGSPGLSPPLGVGRPWPKRRHRLRSAGRRGRL